jgi:hypothetical protein
MSERVPVSLSVADQSEGAVSEERSREVGECRYVRAAVFMSVPRG